MGCCFCTAGDESIFTILFHHAEERDLGVLFEAIRNDSRLGFSLASFVRQATSMREKWLREVCVRGRLCPPPEHWHRNLLQCPPCGAELPQDFQQSFTDGKPCFFRFSMPSSVACLAVLYYC